MSLAFAAWHSPSVPTLANPSSSCATPHRTTPVFAWVTTATVACLTQRSFQKYRPIKARRGVPAVRRRFFGNLFGPEEVIDPADPGRVGVCKEYQSMPGTMVAAEQSEFGWAVVSRHDASEQDGYWNGEAPGEVTQEWRELRLAKTTESTLPGASEGTGQSVVKVSLCEGEAPQQVPYCMALAYTKSLCATALTGAHLQGALPLDKVPAMRALVIGLGAGSIPLWLEHTFSKDKMVVDALEIDPAVVKVATEEMGFPKSALRPSDTAQVAAEDAVTSKSGGSRVYLVPGEDFVEAVAAQGDENYKYDMVFIDAFDKSGKVPPVLVDGDGTFLQSLNKVLRPTSTVVLNLLVGMTGSGSSGGPQEIEAMVQAIQKNCCNESSEIFTIRTPINESSGNQIYGFLKAGRASREMPLKDALKESAEMVNAEFPADSPLGRIHEIKEMPDFLTVGFRVNARPVEAVASGPTPKLVPEDLRAKVTNLNSPRNHVDVSESKALDPPEDPQRIEETSVNQSSNSAIVWPGAYEEGSAEPETISKEPLEEPPVPDVTEGVSAGGPLPAVPVERPEDGMTSTIPEEVPVKPAAVASGPAKGAGLDTSAEMPLLQNEAGSLVVPQTWRFVPPPPEQAPKPSYHDKVLVEEKTQDIASPLREASTPQAASKASEDLTPKKLIEELVQDQVKLDLRDKQQLVEQLVECLIDQVKRYEKELGAEQRANRALKMSLEVEQRKALMYHQRLSELAHLSFPEAADRLLEPEL
eukprot:symbB.v1.2.014012.t2/scaffold1012.1/size144332/5